MYNCNVLGETMSKVNSCSSIESPPPFEYSRRFFLLSKKSDTRVPDPITQCEMEESGLGTKNLNGSINESKFEVMTKLEKWVNVKQLIRKLLFHIYCLQCRLYPDLVMTGGVRWMRRYSFGHELYPITANDNEISGMSGRTLLVIRKIDSKWIHFFSLIFLKHLKNPLKYP